MVMLAPNTARPTMTVSMPLNTIDDSSVVTALASVEADEPSSAAIDASSPRNTPSSPIAANGPICSARPMSCAITTTTVVSPSVAFGLVLM